MSPVGAFPPFIILLIAFVTIEVSSRLIRLPLPIVKFIAIDGLRGYLSLLVIACHSSVWYYYVRSDKWVAPPSTLYVHLGETSVCLFFMITSFLFSQKLTNGKVKSIDWSSLYVSRLFRLYPIYLITLLLVFFIVGRTSGFSLVQSPVKVLIQLIRWFLFSSPDINGIKNSGTIVAGVTWSLQYEWLFYFSLPILGLFIFRLELSLPVLLLAVLSLAVGLVIWHIQFTRCLPFLGGIAGCYCSRIESFCLFAQKSIVSFIILACLFACVYFYPSGYDIGAILLSSIAFIFIAGGNTIFGLLSNHVARKLGQISYGIYLFHGIFLYITFQFVLGFQLVKMLLSSQYWLVIFCLVPALVVFCHILHIYIELPGIELSTVYKKTMGKLVQQGIKRSGLLIKPFKRINTFP